MNNLGNELFEKAYNLMKNETTNTSESIEIQIEKLIGKDNMIYFNYIYQVYK